MRIVGVRRQPRWGKGANRKAKRLAGPVKVKSLPSDRPLTRQLSDAPSPKGEGRC